MPQTILALLAMMLATLFAMQQQRQALHARAQVVRNSIALHATGVLENRLGEIGAMAFDEATTAGEGANSVGELEPIGDFGSEEGQPDDIDDFHQMPGIKDSLVIHRRGPGGGLVAQKLWFKVEIDVTYTDEEGHPVGGPTEYKEATVRVYSLDIPRPDTAELSRLYACGSKCTW